MRYILLALLVLFFAWPSYGQDAAVPDTLDWQQYYPLEVGNVWEWETSLIVAYSGKDRREIIADTLIGRQQYFIQTAYFSVIDLAQGLDFSGRDTTYLRYDTSKTRVVQLLDDGEEADYTCDLTVDFGTIISCERFGPETHVDGSYTSDAFMTVGGDPVSFNAVKGYYNIGGGVNYYHGIGRLPGVGDGAAGSVGFTYLRLGGEDYGEQFVIVGVEEEAVPERNPLRLYPNPVQDRLTVQLGTTANLFDVRVYDVLGRIALAQACSGIRCSLDASALSSGIYFMWVSTGNGRAILEPFTVVR